MVVVKLGAELGDPWLHWMKRPTLVYRCGFVPWNNPVITAS